MRMAILTMPVNDNAGQALPFVHTLIRQELCKAFGGYTCQGGFGGWQDADTKKEYHEFVKLYHVAADWNADNAAKLRLIAARAGVLAEQIAVMLQIDGNAEFITPSDYLEQQQRLAA